MKNFIYIHNISFTYENSIIPLFDNISLQLESGWSSIVGANGSGKTTLLKLFCGLLKPDNGTVKTPGKCYYTEQRTDHIPKGFNEFFDSADKYVYSIKNKLKIEDDWENKWGKLSHGERKRCQIAVALYHNPDVLAIDEPSNHLDGFSKRILLHALKSYKGIGILVSHDRELMDQLCHHTIFVNSPSVEVRNCSYSIAALEIKNEINNQNAEFLLAKKEVIKLKRKVNDQKHKAAHSVKKGSKRNINPRDHDAKSKIDLARLSGKDSLEGQLHKKLQSKMLQAQKKQAALQFIKSQDLGITFNVKEAQKFFPLIVPSGRLKLGQNKNLLFPELTIQYGEKIGIIGNNGIGKSTFLNYILQISNFKSGTIIYIPQEIDIEDSKIMIQKMHQYDREKKGKLMTVISRLGSNPEYVLQTRLPSPGEVRKLMLAEGMLSNPSIIIMDEPTNHMDIESLECVEHSLKQCSCAQILVSHDITFLKNTVQSYWSFSHKNENINEIIIINSI